MSSSLAFRSAWIAASCALTAGILAQQPAAEAAGKATHQSPRNAPLAAFQIELLDLAYRAASAMPLQPHIKNRSRAQEGVVTACLQLDQPLRALKYAQGIANWRRGAGYAGVAFHLARQGTDPKLVGTYLDLADRVATEVAADPEEQAWRAEQIKARIASTLLVLGTIDRAERIMDGVQRAESTASYLVARAGLVEADGYDDLLVEIDRACAQRDIDGARAGLDACVTLHRRFYAEAGKRQGLEERVQALATPLLLRLPFQAQLADNAAAASDHAHARELAATARLDLDAARLPPEEHIPIQARIAAALHAGGDTDLARKELAAALELFAAERARIFDFVRAETLCPVAESYMALGDRDEALRVYGMAIEEGALNPNARQRADDLCATACSMAVHAVEPGAELWARMVRLQQGLRDPW